MKDKILQFLSTKIGKICVFAVVMLVLCFPTHIICFHQWAEATCTEPETCTICGRTRGEAKGHDFTEATCTLPQVCKVCGVHGNNALGHNVTDWDIDQKATCDKGEEKHGTCTRCGEVVTEKSDALGHDWTEWEVTKEATTKAEGEKNRECKRCGKKESEKIAKKDLFGPNDRYGKYGKYISDFKEIDGGGFTCIVDKSIYDDYPTMRGCAMYAMKKAYNEYGSMGFGLYADYDEGGPAFAFDSNWGDVIYFYNEDWQRVPMYDYAFLKSDYKYIMNMED